MLPQPEEGDGDEWLHYWPSNVVKNLRVISGDPKTKAVLKDARRQINEEPVSARYELTPDDLQSALGMIRDLLSTLGRPCNTPEERELLSREQIISSGRVNS